MSAELERLTMSLKVQQAFEENIMEASWSFISHEDLGKLITIVGCEIDCIKAKITEIETEENN
jgi:hypothetical protein